MLDTELLEELNEASRKVAGVSRLLPEVAETHLRRLADTFVADPSSLHWWAFLKFGSTRIPYDPGDGLSKLEGLIGDKVDAILVVTDEEEPPWPVYAGTATQLIAMLRECRFCEFMIASRDTGWVVFDTHMNELVGLGLKC